LLSASESSLFKENRRTWVEATATKADPDPDLRKGLADSNVQGGLSALGILYIPNSWRFRLRKRFVRHVTRQACMERTFGASPQLKAHALECGGEATAFFIRFAKGGVKPPHSKASFGRATHTYPRIGSLMRIVVERGFFLILYYRNDDAKDAPGRNRQP
jgi:hypothetical protein